MFLFSVTFLITLQTFAIAADYPGQVEGVADGDTLDVLHDGRAEPVRLHGIDCPENGQAFGNRAKQLASDLAFNKEVTVKTVDRDKYGRTVAEVVLPDGKSLNQELIKEGACWWYRKYAPGNATLERLEREAKEAKRGL